MGTKDKAYVVTAPYVTLRLKDETGAWQINGFYTGATVPDNVDPESLRHHLDSGMVAESGSNLASLVSPGGPTVAEQLVAHDGEQGEDKTGEAMEAKATEVVKDAAAEAKTAAAAAKSAKAADK